MRDLLSCLRAMRTRPLAALGAVGAGVLTAGSALALAGLSAWLITKAWTMPPVLALTLAVTSVRGLGITRGLMRYVERLASHRLALRGLTELRAALYARLAGAAPAADRVPKHNGPASLRGRRNNWWTHLGSNQGPAD